MKRYFTFREFVKLGGHVADIPISIDVSEKITRHIFELNPVRYAVGKPVIVTSSYRPVWWELVKDRSGESQHTFTGDGAVDITCVDIESLLHKIRDTDYTRIAFYPDKNFLHCDYKPSNQKWFIGPKWYHSNFDEIIDMI